MKNLISIIAAIVICCNTAIAQEWHKYDKLESQKELSLRFRAKSPTITIRYSIDKKSISNRTTTNIDLFTIDKNGVNVPQKGEFSKNENIYTVKYDGVDYSTIGHKIRGTEFQLWLPAECKVESIEVGVESESFFEYANPREDRPIVVFNKSISAAQSAGVRSVAVLSRAIDRPVWEVTNEKELYDIDAVAYVLDEEKGSIMKKLKQRSPNTPIVVSKISDDAQCPVRLEQTLRAKLNCPTGSISTTIPVTQRRVPSQEWQEECRLILNDIRTSEAKCAIVGNSIVHNWGGSRKEKKSNHESWYKYMSDYVNLGIGADRVENVLARVYNDQMEVKPFEKIIIMIGTNNLNASTSYEDIVTGVENLVEQIKIRQPQAEITLVGILPRKDYPWEELQKINMGYKRIAAEKGIKYKCIGHALMNENNEWRAELFSDRVHPNTKGYDAIGQALMME